MAGGTGTLGRSLLPLLAASGEPVRILTRGVDGALPTTPGVQVVTGDIRDAASVDAAMVGVRTVVSAINGFGGREALGVRVIDRDGNATLVDAAVRAGVEHIVLISILGASDDHPMELFRMKAAAEAHLKASGLHWTIVRPTAYQETWLEVIGRPLVETGRTRIFGRGRNPINFVSADDVAQIVEQAIVDPSVHGATIEIAGPENLSFEAFVEVVRSGTGASGSVSHVPLPMLRLMSHLLRPIKPVLAGQVAAAVVMNTRDMTADPTERLRRFPSVPCTPLGDVVRRRFRAVADAPSLRPTSAPR
ncbi:MAG TPA: SDR family oxidoreductase [Candidatus Limnocylindrales bacterium]|nr:SDR family oxidoreductase [Candidatus Limnocylindrales bacterium]